MLRSGIHSTPPGLFSDVLCNCCHSVGKGGEQGNRVWASSANDMCELLADCVEAGKEMFRSEFVRRGLSTNALTPAKMARWGTGPM